MTYAGAAEPAGGAVEAQQPAAPHMVARKLP
jgi:hypothetical protein